MPDALAALRGILQVDRTVHEPARLVLLALMSVVDEADFVFLQDRTGLSGGNLSSHLSRLEGAGLVIITKGFRGARPQTLVRVSQAGREAFDSYVATMSCLLEVPR